MTLPLPAQQAWFDRLRSGSRDAAAEGRQRARQVDARARLDLVDLGAEEGEGLAGHRTGPHPAEVGDADTFQGQ